ncbi:MAG TPA: ParB/Srx family N-terminal domain-containing protein, partial [Spirillospora sp.]|nr:ParB/Srx family N-terminal domain-containing protein [Spirillospora sp.]
MAEQPDLSQRFPIADGLYVMWLEPTVLREQDVNAQTMSPRHFDRLTENIRGRGMIESLPYVYWPDEEGVPEIVSGHHRCRAARA